MPSEVFSVYWSQYKYFQTEIKERDPNCTNGSHWIWSNFVSCAEGTTEQFGFIIGIIMIPIWSLAFISLHIGIQNTMFKRLNGSLIQALIQIFDFTGAVLSFQLASQIMFSFVCLIVFTGNWCRNLALRSGNKLESNNYHTCKHKWRSRMHVVIGTASICILVIAIIGIVSLINTYTSLENIQPHYNKREYVAGISIGGLATILLIISSIKGLHSLRSVSFASNTVKFIRTPFYLFVIADVFYIFSVQVQRTSMNLFVYSCPWIITRLTMIIRGVIIVSLVGKTTCLSNQQPDSTEDMESLISNAESEETTKLYLPGGSVDTRGEATLHEDIASDNTNKDVEQNVSTQPFANRRLVQLMNSTANCQSPLLSTESTATSFTADQEFEPESISVIQQLERSRFIMNQRRSSFQLHLSSLATETRSQRIAQWFETSTPEEEMSVVSDPTNTGKLLEEL